MTIPRMELSAAVVVIREYDSAGAERANNKRVRFLDRQHLRCIKNEDKRFQTFVANRIATIREASSPTQWRYVDTKCNPADDASHGLSVESFLQERRWLKGPQFLWLPEETWPQPPVGMDGRVEDEDPEVKKTSTSFATNSTRAVHIEIAHSLDTDSFINAMRRFISRRGQPHEIRSDNGSNFAGSEKELREAVSHWNQRQIHEFLPQKSAKWIFNSPAGSHHGGVWERCI